VPLDLFSEFIVGPALFLGADRDHLFEVIPVHGQFRFPDLVGGIVTSQPEESEFGMCGTGQKQTPGHEPVFGLVAGMDHGKFDTLGGMLVQGALDHFRKKCAYLGRQKSCNAATLEISFPQVKVWIQGQDFLADSLLVDDKGHIKG
jgi:hypothetical protein